MKRQLAFFLTVVMLLTALVPMTAFATEPTSGFRITQSNGTTNDYTTITDAVAALVDGDTLTMYEDASTTASLEIKKTNITINGNGKCITHTGGESTRVFDFKGSSANATLFTANNRQKVEVKNLNIKYSATNNSGTYVFIMRGYTDITFDAVNIEATAGERAIYLGATATESMFTFKNSTLNSTYGGIGLANDCDTVKTVIENSTITSNARGIVVYQGELEIKSGTYTGTSNGNPTLQLSGGNVIISGGEFIAEQDRVIRVTNPKPVNIIINGGTFTSKTTPSNTDHATLRMDQDNSNTNNMTVTVNNGVFENKGTQRAVAMYYGTLNVNGGMFKSASHNTFDVASSSTLNINKGYVSNGTNQAAVKVRGTAKANIKGGVFTTSYTSAVVTEESGALTVDNGYFYATGTRCTVRIFDNSSATINGGYFYYKFNSQTESDKLYGVVCATKNGNSTEAAGNKFTINGGTFVTTSGGSAVGMIGYSNSTYTINGGAFYNGTSTATSEILFTGSHNDITEKSNIAVLTELPEMLDGAAVRIVRLATVNPSATDIAENSGLRFTTTISAAMQTSLEGKANVKYGTLICPTDYLVDNGLEMPTHAGLDALGLSYVDIEATETGTTEEANGDLTLRAALTAIKAENYDRAFSAVAYASYTIGDVTVYIYSVYDAATNSRSIKSVATSALADTTVTFNEQQKAILNAYAGN